MYTGDKFGMVLLGLLWVASFSVDYIKKDSKPNPINFIFIVFLFYNLVDISEAFIFIFSLFLNALSFISILFVSLFYLVFIINAYSDRNYLLLMKNASSFSERVGYIAEAIVRTYLLVGFFAIANLIVSAFIHMVMK